MNGQEVDGQRSLRSHGSTLSITFKLPKDKDVTGLPAPLEGSRLSSSLKLKKNGTLEAPDLIFEQKIALSRCRDDSTPKASPKPKMSKRGLQARYSGEVQEPASSLDIIGSTHKDDLIVTTGSQSKKSARNAESIKSLYDAPIHEATADKKINL